MLGTEAYRVAEYNERCGNLEVFLQKPIRAFCFLHIAELRIAQYPTIGDAERDRTFLQTSRCEHLVPRLCSARCGNEELHRAEPVERLSRRQHFVYREPHALTSLVEIGRAH